MTRALLRGPSSVRRAALSALGLVWACTLSNLSPAARFSEAAYRLNDAARWGQVELATAHVAPRYKPTFLARRREWGERISIAEVELLHLHLSDDKDSAVSELSLSWYDPAGMSLRKSFITQRWASERGQFRLVDEAVNKGDPAIFAEPGGS